MSNPTEKRPRGRPRKNGEPAQNTRETLLRAGVELLTEKGFLASGLDQILSRANIPKGSFYYYFSSKEAFGLALIDYYNRYFSSKLEHTLQQSPVSPLARLGNFVQSACTGMQRYEFQRGCLIGNLGQEMSALPASFRQALLDVLQQWQGYVAKTLLEAKHHGQIGQHIDCEVAAYNFWTGWEGAVLRAKLERSCTPMKYYFLQFTQFLECESQHSANHTTGENNV